MSTRITVAIPTYNRAPLLKETLTSIVAQQLPPEVQAECLVVDNRSTDDTALVVAAFARDAPIPVRYIYETRAGSSSARNRAVAEAHGSLILFIDDDAVAEPDWGAQLLTEVERRDLDVACGMVLPRWSRKPPLWLGPRLYIRLALHDTAQMASLPAPQLESIHNYFSANVCFRRRSFELFGGFREELGVVGGDPMSGEDTELFARIIAHGGKVGFVSSARVHHLIPPERMSRAYLRRKSYAFGYGSAIAGGHSHNHLDKLGRNAVRMIFDLARGDREGAVYHELECANFFGYWHGRIALRRQAAAAARVEKAGQ